MPPLTRAETYGPLQQLERQVDEYYEALSLDPRRATAAARGDPRRTSCDERLHEELGFVRPADEAAREALLARLDAYLCELKESQIRDGLHVFGSSPQGRQRIDTLRGARALPTAAPGPASAACSPRSPRTCGLDADGFDPLAADWGALARRAPCAPGATCFVALAPRRAHARTAGAAGDPPRDADAGCRAGDIPGFDTAWPHTAPVLQRLRGTLAPRLDACGPLELAQLLRGLAGRFVPPGPSGAPSRGRLDVLPTGRNFYSVDTRAVPTPTAYAMGAAAAERLVERHLQDHGEILREVGLSVWGTATMRTGGDDVAQALALLGVRPKWAEGSGRVVDTEVLPMSLRHGRAST